MKRFAYLKKDYINKFFCHELFHHVFIMFNYEDIKQASLVCHIWNDHVQQMRNALFRRYYNLLGGDASKRKTKVLDWEQEVKDMLRLTTDIQLFQFSQSIADDCLRDSVVEDGGLVMDVCKYVMECGGRVAAANLLIRFQKQISSQTQKSEIIDIVDYMCDTMTCIDGDDGDDEAVSVVCLKEFLESGKFIKDVRLLFLQDSGQIESPKIFEWINNYCTEKKFTDNVKKEVHEFLEILADRTDDDFSSYYTLKKISTTKRLP